MKKWLFIASERESSRCNRIARERPSTFRKYWRASAYVLFFILVLSFKLFFPFDIGHCTAFAEEGSVFVVSPADETALEINFFYKTGCPHCQGEEVFLNKIEKKYPEVKISRYSVSDPQNHEFLRKIAEVEGAQRYIGLVPLTFVDGNFFVGFDSEEKMGRQIENYIRESLGYPSLPPAGNEITLPLIGKIDLSKHSLSFLAVILGFLDGFNVCSLGALVLILGLVLSLKSRTKTLVLGGVFIATAALIYGFLIFIWYKIFFVISSYLRSMEILLGFLGVGGGVYFLRQFFKFKKQGPACEIGKQDLSLKLSQKVREILKKPGNIILLGAVVVLFAVAITIIEFPCSAVLPVIFAGILNNSGISTLSYLFYLAIYLLFYLLDEIIVFLIAVFTKKIWIASPKFSTWINFAAAVASFLLGVYYLFMIR